MTRDSKRALRMLQEHGDPVIGPGGGVVTSSRTLLLDGQPWIHWRTARTLTNAGLAEIHDYGYDGVEITLTPKGLAA